MPYSLIYKNKGILKDKIFTHLMCSPGYKETNMFYSKENLSFFLNELKFLSKDNILLYNSVVFLHTLCGTSKTGINEPIDNKPQLIINVYELLKNRSPELAKSYKDYVYSLLIENNNNKNIIVSSTITLESIYNQLK